MFFHNRAANTAADTNISLHEEMVHFALLHLPKEIQAAAVPIHRNRRVSMEVVQHRLDDAFLLGINPGKGLCHTGGIGIFLL